MNPLRIASVLLLAAGVLLGQDQPYVLKARRLFDSVNGRIVEPGLAVVSGGKIQASGSATALTGDFDPGYNGALA